MRMCVRVCVNAHVCKCVYTLGKYCVLCNVHYEKRREETEREKERTNEKKKEREREREGERNILSNIPPKRILLYPKCIKLQIPCRHILFTLFTFVVLDERLAGRRLGCPSVRPVAAAAAAAAALTVPPASLWADAA